MQTYDTYLERIFALPFENASRIFTTIKTQIENDEVMTDLYHDLLSRSIEYSAIRAEWQMMTTEEKGAIDKRRSEIHDAVIREFDILARNLGKLGHDTSWRDELGDLNRNPDYRKRIGDMACYLVLFEGLNARTGNCYHTISQGSLRVKQAPLILTICDGIKL